MKCKAKNKFRVNLSNQNINVDLSKAKFVVAESDIEKLKTQFTEGLTELKGLKVGDAHGEPVAG